MDKPPSYKKFVNPALPKKDIINNNRKSGVKVDITKLLSTFFGVGYLPYFPGTWASLAGVLIYFLLRNNEIIYLCLAIVILITGFLIAAQAEKRFNRKDCRFIVIDEIAAILFVLYFVPKNIFSVILSFLAFRFFDVIKPFPIKKIENFKGSWGIMLDDLAAGVYTVGSIYLVNIFLVV